MRLYPQQIPDIECGLIDQFWIGGTWAILNRQYSKLYLN